MHNIPINLLSSHHKYCNPYHLVSAYAKAYETTIIPLPNYKTWGEVNLVLNWLLI